MGLLVKVVPHTHNVGTHDRCNTTVEPMIKQQWFVKMEEMAKPAIEAVKNGKLKFVPERFDKTYLHWLENIRDWCISRQLWWGHRIPAYYCDDCGEIVVAEEMLRRSARSAAALTLHRMRIPWIPGSPLHCGRSPHWAGRTRPRIWTISIPTDVLVTGYDIIFFWVIRMVFSGSGADRQSARSIMY